MISNKENVEKGGVSCSSLEKAQLESSRVDNSGVQEDRSDNVDALKSDYRALVGGPLAEQFRAREGEDVLLSFIAN